MRPYHLFPLFLALLLLTACGSTTPVPADTPVPTPSPAPKSTLPPASPTPTLSAPLQEGVDRFLSGQGLGDAATVKSLDFQQSIVPGEYMEDVYRLTYVPQEGAEEVTVYLLYYVGPSGQEGPYYKDAYATEERVAQVGIEQAALEASTGLSTLEFSFPRINAHGYFGLGIGDFLGYADWLDADAMETTVLDNYDVWWPDDYWYETRYEGLTLLCYHSTAENINAIYKIETTRDDLWTYRGARVGMTKAEILDLYPEIDPEEPWGAEWGNHLAYQSNPGALADLYIHFTFDEGDVLTKIIMENYYD